MKSPDSKTKSGFRLTDVVHLSLSALLPVLVYVLVRLDLIQIALWLILLSKWRMLAVKPRYWMPHIRANAVDIIVGLSILAFMIVIPSIAWQLFWTFVYVLWLTVLKPRSDALGVSAQAFIAHLFGMVALYIFWSDAPLWGIVLGTWFVAYMSARHFFTNLEEPYTPFLAHFWGYTAAAISWVLAHYLLFFGVLAQPALLLTVIAYGLGTLYYFDRHEQLTTFVRRQSIFIMVAIVVIIIVFGDWSDKAI